MSDVKQHFSKLDITASASACDSSQSYHHRQFFLHLNKFLPASYIYIYKKKTSHFVLSFKCKIQKQKLCSPLCNSQDCRQFFLNLNKFLPASYIIWFFILCPSNITIQKIKINSASYNSKVSNCTVQNLFNFCIVHFKNHFNF